MASHQTADEVDHERIASLALTAYSDLPPRGAKPGRKSNNRLEWTVLAAFILSYPTTQQTDYALISLATGLKCLPYTSLPLNGDILHDQHAEVLARRGARLWLVQRLQQQVGGAVVGGPELFEPSDEGKSRWRLRDGVRLHLYISTLPCGDASTKLLEYQRAAQDAVAGRSDVLTPTQLLESHLQGDASASSSGRDSGIVRGRASSSQMTASLGSLRTKPGRPDSPPSICMSCSDKIALWNAPGIGMQGSLLSALLQPVFIHSVTLCDHPTRHIFPTFPQQREGEEEQRKTLKRVLAEDCRRALQRARSADDERPITIGWSTAPFPHSKEAQLENAWSNYPPDPQSNPTEQAARFKAEHEPSTCPNSIVFIRDPTLLSSKGKVENLASGTKMGAPTKRTSKDGLPQPLKPQARSMVCRLNAFRSFVAAHASIAGRDAAEVLYSDAKEGALGEGTKEYRRRKAVLLGGKEKADEAAQRFLAGARDGTAIQAVLPGCGREAVAVKDGEEREMREEVFGKWLRTPSVFSQFDLQGQASLRKPVNDTVTSITTVTLEADVKTNGEIQFS